MTGRVFVLSLLLASTALAQMGRGSSDPVGRVRIRITLPDRTPCTASTRVALLGNMGFSVAETSANGECIATFFDVPSGRYRVALSGDVVNTDGGEIDVTTMQDVEVRARRAADSANAFTAASTFVSVGDLQVPTQAAKEFGKANQMIDKQEWSKAAGRLHKAISLYPSYAAAYNNLGAVYSRLGQTAPARSALNEAISFDDHLAAAYINLARLDVAEKNFTDAEILLLKEAALGAPTADELNLLAYAEVMDQHFDQAIETTRRGHAGQLSHHAFLHLIAANVYERERRITDSVAELQTYLREEPTAARAEEVKRAIVTLQAQVSNSQRTAGPS